MGYIGIIFNFLYIGMKFQVSLLTTSKYTDAITLQGIAVEIVLMDPITFLYHKSRVEP